MDSNFSNNNSESVIGIDLGTTNSIVSYVENGKVKILKIGRSEITPSAIFFESSQQQIFGEKALKKMMTYPECGIRLFKRMLRNPGEKNRVEFFKKENSQLNMDSGKSYLIDTNIFVNHPYILSRLRDDENVVLAYTVIDELKYRCSDKSTEYQAKEAIDQILKWQKSKAERIVFEESDIRILPEGLFEEDKTNNNNNDNKILSIALKKKELFEEVVLLTSDKALQIKAQSCGVEYVDLKDFLTSHTIVNSIPNEYIELSGEEASAMFLEYLRKEASQKLKKDIKKAVITVPANFAQVEIEATKRAGLAAGFEEIKTLKEPISAAIVYGLENESNKKILVYDFGGGTFDVSIIEAKGKGDLESLSVGGNSQLGGEDITDGMIQLIYDKLYDEYDLDMDSLEASELTFEQYRYNKNTVYEVAERIKIDLSKSMEESINLININVPNNEQTTYSTAITRDEFENEILKEISSKASKALTSTLSGAGLYADDIDIVVLAGGTASIPMFQKNVEEYFGKEPNFQKDTATVVAQGAALMAEMLWKPGGPITLRPTIHDKTVHDFGVGIEKYKFDCLIKSGESLPIVVQKQYMPAKDGQDTVEILIYNRMSGCNNEKTFDDDIEFLDKVTIKGLPNVDRRNIVITVSFEINEEYILSVTAEVTDKSGNLIKCENLEIIKDSNK